MTAGLPTPRQNANLSEEHPSRSPDLTKDRQIDIYILYTINVDITAELTTGPYFRRFLSSRK